MSSQIVMTSTLKRPKTALQYVFTEQGLAMLRGVLNSDKAMRLNITITRALNKELTGKLKVIESKYNRRFRDV